MKEFSLDEFAKFIGDEVARERLPHAREIALETACKMIEAEAKRAIGTYLFDWPQLAQSTQAERERAGYAANEPLLRTGEMRDSISYEIEIPGEEATVGSDSDVAVYQELGTTNIPPRPFLLPSFFYLEKSIMKMIGETVAAALAPVSIQTEIVRKAMVAVRDVGHTARDFVDDENAPRQ